MTSGPASGANPSLVLVAMSSEQRANLRPELARLARPGIELVFEESAESALDLVKKLDPALVLVGIAIDMMDGLEFVAVLLKKHPDFRGAVVVLPDKGDPFPPVVQSKDPVTGRAKTESTDFAGIEKLVATLGAGSAPSASPAAPPAVKPPAVEPPAVEKEKEPAPPPMVAQDKPKPPAAQKAVQKEPERAVPRPAFVPAARPLPPRPASRPQAPAPQVRAVPAAQEVHEAAPTANMPAVATVPSQPTSEHAETVATPPLVQAVAATSEADMVPGLPTVEVTPQAEKSPSSPPPTVPTSSPTEEKEAEKKGDPTLAIPATTKEETATVTRPLRGRGRAVVVLMVVLLAAGVATGIFVFAKRCDTATVVPASSVEVRPNPR